MGDNTPPPQNRAEWRQFMQRGHRELQQIGQHIAQNVANQAQANAQQPTPTPSPPPLMPRRPSNEQQRRR